jgi:hypothetical protein
MKNCDKMNIYIIYINEAHATDVWNIGESAGVLNSSHKKIEDRIECIEKFKNEYKLTIPIYADNMENDFETKFASWPFRYFVTQGKTIIKIGLPNDSEFDMFELFDFLKSL